MSYIVKASHYQSQEKIFEGPLDLLLDLIEKEKLDITEVSLAQVADQFLKYLENSENANLEHLADFLLVAGKLILIKSKAILPMLELEKEEEEDIEELKARLLEYKKFKEAAKELIKLESRKKILFSRQSYSGMKTIFCPPKKLLVSDLRDTFENVLDKLPKVEILAKETIKKVISIKDKIEYLKKNLMERIEMTFHGAVSNNKDKVEIIITFLAMLELVRNNMVSVEQEEMFGEIRIISNESRIRNQEL
ncbi:segregation/condensation protein A [Candidatus Parcubacteria bacterium]|nr:segregation/condensation protein A [Candidatus Parcubacteria bacterium]